MLFNKIQFSEIILNNYIQSWYIWVTLLIVGILLVIYSDKVSTTYRESKKIESSGAGLVALSIVIHISVLWALV